MDKKLIEGHPCYDTLVSYKVDYINIQVSIKASQALTLGGTAFAKDAVIANFTLIRPKDLIVEVNHKFNKECCDAPPANPPKEDESDSVDIATAARFMRAKFRTDTSATYTKHR